MKTITTEEIEILQEVQNILFPSMFVNAVYTSPSQSLRDQADEIEREDAIKNKFKALVEKFN